MSGSKFTSIRHFPVKKTIMNFHFGQLINMDRRRRKNAWKKLLVSAWFICSENNCFQLCAVAICSKRPSLMPFRMSSKGSRVDKVIQISNQDFVVIFRPIIARLCLSLLGHIAQSQRIEWIKCGKSYVRQIRRSFVQSQFWMRIAWPEAQLIW